MLRIYSMEDLVDNDTRLGTMLISHKSSVLHEGSIYSTVTGSGNIQMFEFIGTKNRNVFLKNMANGEIHEHIELLFGYL